MAPTARRGLPPRSCEVCSSRKGLLRCGGCQVMYYCSRDHQASHRATHKAACNVLKKARDKLNKEEAAIRDRPDDFMLPWNVFEDYVGQFWGLPGTRDYMRARFTLAEKTLERFDTHEAAVEAATDHMLDLLRLDRTDSMGLRDMVPALLLRLGRDQEAYDLVRWWAVARPDEEEGEGEGEGEGEAGGPTPGAGADALEVPRWLWAGGKQPMALSHAAAAALVKIRIMFDLQAARNTGLALGGRRSPLPQEIVDLVRGHVVAAGGIVASRPGLVTAGEGELSAEILRVKRQVMMLIGVANKLNMYFWVAMMYPDEALACPPVPYSLGTVDEAFLMVKYSYRSWEETPGAIDIIRAAYAAAG